MVGCPYAKFIIEDIVIGYDNKGIHKKVGSAWLILNLEYLVEKADALYNDPTWDSEECYNRNKSEYVCFDLEGDERRRSISRREAFVTHMISGPIKDICHPSYLVKHGYYGFGWLDYYGKSYYYDTGKRGKNGLGACVPIDKKTKKVQKHIDVGFRDVSRQTADDMLSGATNLIWLDSLHYMKYPMAEEVKECDWDY